MSRTAHLKRTKFDSDPLMGSLNAQINRLLVVRQQRWVVLAGKTRWMRLKGLPALKTDRRRARARIRAQKYRARKEAAKYGITFEQAWTDMQKRIAYRRRRYSDDRMAA